MKHIIPRVISNSRLFFALIVCCFLVSSCERLKVVGVLEAAKSIRTAQRGFHQKHGRYGSLIELADEKRIDNSLSDGRDFDHLFELSASENIYHLIVLPTNLDEMRSNGNHEILTLFLDHSGTIRASVDPERTANKMSDPIREQ